MKERGNAFSRIDWQEDESSTAESAELITEQVKLAIKQMKKGKAAVGGHSRNVASWRSRNKMGDGALKEGKSGGLGTQLDC